MFYFKKRLAHFGNDCSICLDCLNPETKTTTLCNHNFCRPCIDRWRMFNSTCPNCRAPLNPPVVRTARREIVVAEGAPDVSLDGLQIGDQERGQDGRIWMVQEYRGRTRWAPIRSLMEGVVPRQLFQFGKASIINLTANEIKKMKKYLDKF